MFDDEDFAIKPDHFHEWAWMGSPWGIIIGITECQICGEIAKSEDFPQLADRTWAQS